MPTSYTEGGLTMLMRHSGITDKSEQWMIRYGHQDLICLFLLIIVKHFSEIQFIQKEHSTDECSFTQLMSVPSLI